MRKPKTRSAKTDPGDNLCEMPRIIGPNSGLVFRCYGFLKAHRPVRRSCAGHGCAALPGVKTLSFIRKSAAQPLWTAPTRWSFPKADLSALRGRAERGGAEPRGPPCPRRDAHPRRQVAARESSNELEQSKGAAPRRAAAPQNFRIRLRPAPPATRGPSRTRKGKHSSGAWAARCPEARALSPLPWCRRRADPQTAPPPARAKNDYPSASLKGGHRTFTAPP